MANSLICNNCGKPYEGEGSGGTVSSGVVLHRYSKNQSSRGWVCTACGAYHPIMDSEEEGERLYRAFQMLRESDFKGAEEAFDAFLKEYPENAEAYWGKLRAKYRIAYEQGKDGVLVPICGAPNANSIFKNKDYRKALQYADEDHKKFLTAQAEYIEQSRRAAKPKRIKTVAVWLASFLLLVAVSFGVYMLNTQGLIYGKNADGTYYVSGVSVLMGTELVIPDTHNGALVTGIGDGAFKDCSNLTSITIPDSVTSIGELAFYDCDGLTRFTIPDSVTSIGESAFDGCSGLRSVTIGNGVTSIGSYAFSACSGLTSVTIGNGVTSIGESAFEYCSGLTRFTIPDSVTSIGNSAFLGCSRLTDVYYAGSEEDWAKISVDENNSPFTSATIHYGQHNHRKVTLAAVAPTCTETGLTEGSYCSECNEILVAQTVVEAGHTWYKTITREPTKTEDGAYLCNCTVCGEQMEERIPAIGSEGLAFTSNGDGTCYVSGIGTCTDADVVIPAEYNGETVTSIGSSAFRDCDGLTSVVIPQGVTNIEGWAFISCTNLESVVIPNSVTSIGYKAFRSCDKLTSVVIPEGVTSIGDRVFRFCYSLETVVIPSSVIRIGDAVFESCDSLTVITVDENNENYCSIDGVLFDKAVTTIICYPAKKQGTEYAIPDSVTSIGDYAFYNCRGLTSIEIPDSVTSIGSSAFDNCDGLTSVTIGNSVISIGDEAFAMCDGLTSVTIGNSVISIGDEAFRQCKNLTNVTIGSGVTSIGDEAFIYCDSLTSITIPDSVTSIGESAFICCGSLTAITVDESNENYCSIDGVLFDKSVTNIICYPAGKQETEYVIPESVTSIGSYAFYNCDGLTSVTIGNSVISIGDHAFYQCVSLTEIIVDENNENYRSIDGVLFDKAVTTIVCYPAGKQETEYVIPEGVTSIGDSEFYDCDGLTSITIPNSVTNIGDHAFYYCSGLTSIEIPDSVTSIGEWAFVYCDGLTSVTIGNGVTSIGEWAFYDCDGLTDVYYAGSKVDWAKISIGSYNDLLTSATIHYNSK